MDTFNAIAYDETDRGRLVGSLYAAVFWFILLIPCKIASKLFMSKAYSNLSPADQNISDLRITRSIAGVYGVYMGLRLIFDPTFQPLWDDVVNGKIAEGGLGFKIIVGFFIFEMVMFYAVKWMYNSSDNTLLIHHVLGIVGYSAFYYSNCGQWFGFVLFTEEFSAPFTGISWMLQKSGQSKSYAYVINQIAMCIVWVVFRMCFDYLILWGWYTQMDNCLKNMPLHLNVILLTGTTIMAFYLNPIWLKMKFEGIIRWFKDDVHPNQKKAKGN